MQMVRLNDLLNLCALTLKKKNLCWQSYFPYRFFTGAYSSGIRVADEIADYNDCGRLSRSLAVIVASAILVITQTH